MKLFKRIMPLILIIGDISMIALSITLAYKSREWFIEPNDIDLQKYLYFTPIYLVSVALFAYEGLYRYRYDFWQETKLILQGIALSALIVFSYLALTRSVEHYSRFVMIGAFFYMALLIPIQKRVLKWIFYHIGWWKREAKLYGKDSFLKKSIFENYYLGYVESKNGSQSVFVNARALKGDKVDEILKKEIRKHHELLFIPLLKDFNLSESKILELFNSRANLVLLTNRLASRSNLIIKNITDKTLAGLFFLAALPVMGVIASVLYATQGSVLYRQKRLGEGGTTFEVLKFRTMKKDAQKLLEEYLRANPQKVLEWRTYRKLKGYDPRVTKIGKFLRQYSLDELPQLINVLKGEMSLVGPRPYIPQELAKLQEHKEIILSVKPGITGLWQVLGRNELSFEERIEIDRWYVYNWSLWSDIVILLKTFKTVLEKHKTY